MENIPAYMAPITIELYVMDNPVPSRRTIVDLVQNLLRELGEYVEELEGIRASLSSMGPDYRLISEAITKANSSIGLLKRRLDTLTNPLRLIAKGPQEWQEHFNELVELARLPVDRLAKVQFCPID